MIASAGGAIFAGFLILFAMFVGFVYLVGRVFGAGIRKGGDLWRSGQHEADRRYQQSNVTDINRRKDA